MRTLTADTKITVKRSQPTLTGETKIRLSQILDLSIWHKLNKLIEDTRKKPAHKPAGSPNSTGGQFAREYNTEYETVKEKLKERYEEVEGKLKPEEKKAIKDYTENSDPFNDFVRGKPQDPKTRAVIAPQVAALDAALEKSEVGDNIQVYRVLSIEPEEINKIIPIKGIDLNDIPKSSRNLYINHILENQPIKSKQSGYLSTTINPYYRMKHPKSGKPFISYTIKVPHEAKGLYIEDLSRVPHQEELLVLRGYALDLKAVKYDVIHDRYDIEAEVIL